MIGGSPRAGTVRSRLIGKGMLVAYPDQAFRSLKAPGTAYDNKLIHKDPQPARMADFVDTKEDDGGIHINSGIPNHAFFLAAKALGGHAWVERDEAPDFLERHTLVGHDREKLDGDRRERRQPLEESPVKGRRLGR